MSRSNPSAASVGSTKGRSRSSLIEWLYLGLALVIFGGYLAYSLYGDRIRADARERERLTHQGVVVAENLGRQLNVINLALASTLRDIPRWRAQNNGRNLAIQHLRVVNDVMPGVLTLIILDRTGTVEYSDKPELVGQNVAHRDYFETVVHGPNPGTLYVSAPFKTIRGHFTINMMRMVPNPEGQFDGIVVAALDVSEFKILLNSVLYRPDVRASLIHGDGTLFLTAPDSNNVNILDILEPGSFFAQHMNGGQATSFFAGAAGTADKERMVAIQTIQPVALAMDKPLIIAVERGTEAIFARWHQRVLQDAKLMGLLALIAVMGMLSYRRWRRTFQTVEANYEAERQRSVEALRQSEDTMGAILYHMLNGVAYCQMLFKDGEPYDWVYLRTNPAFHRQTGLGETDGKRVSEIVPGIRDIDAQLFEAYGRVAKGGKPEQFELFVEALGQWFSVQVFSPKTECFVAVFDVVTERMQRDLDLAKAQQDLLREKTLLRGLIDSIEDLIFIKDRNGVYLDCNKASEKLIGIVQRDQQGNSDFDFFDSQTAETIRSRDQEVIAKAVPVRVEEWVTYPDGRKVLVETTKTPLYGSDGQVEGLVGISRDITERKQAEVELAQYRSHLEELVAVRTSELAQSRDAAEAGNRAKTIFLANMSHELRTPMNGVMGMINLALRRATDPRQIEWLNKSKDAAQRMVNVVNDIIDFSKIEAERLPLDERSFSLRQLIDDSLALQNIVGQTKGLKLIHEIPVTFPDQLSGDVFHLRQILLNFLGNACKFSEQGTITVRVSAVEQDSDSVLARIEVEDQGIGISSEQQATLFHPFAQSDGSMTRKYGGSGLGLIISKRLANLMGGDVGMVSQAGRGSTFWATVRLKLTKGSEVGI